MKPLCTELFHIPHLVCFIKTPKVTFVICPKDWAMCLDWFLDLERCSPPAFHGSCSFPTAQGHCTVQGRDSLQSTEVKACRGARGCSEQPRCQRQESVQLLGSFAAPDPMGTRPCPAGDITWTLQAPPCLPGLLQLSPTSTSLPKTQALWTPELIWSNIYSLIKKLFISLSDDKIMVE